MIAAKESLDKILKHAGSLNSLQGSLLSAANGRAIRSLLITSGRDREGKSTVAVGMAAAMARQANAKVLLVDGNFRRPALAALFGLQDGPGLREFILGSSGEQVIQQTDEPRLSLLTAGGSCSIAELLTKLPERLKVLCEEFDYVVFDGDSTLTSSEAALLAQHVDGVVLVAECEQTKWEIISLCKEKLTRLGGKVLGVVLNKRQFYIPGAFYGKV
ncbi:MAG: CpsD/CapB family tyrosine-protein kinase [Verrucomicrobia bacterium]|nr:CpsD/CapB family tyrosine-protein kinase [Verrucomicrobiota bacterium]